MVGIPLKFHELGGGSPIDMFRFQQWMDSVKINDVTYSNLIRYCYCHSACCSDYVLTSSVNGVTVTINRASVLISLIFLMMVDLQVTYYDGLHCLNFDKTTIYQSIFDSVGITHTGSVQKNISPMLKLAYLLFPTKLVPPLVIKLSLSAFCLVLQCLPIRIALTLSNFIIAHMFAVKSILAPHLFLVAPC